MSCKFTEVLYNKKSNPIKEIFKTAKDSFIDTNVFNITFYKMA